MMEETDTNSQYGNEIPDGPHTFEVGTVRKVQGFYVWELDYDGTTGEQILFANQMGPLLRVLGCSETSPGKFQWDMDMQQGKKFEATVSRGPDKKGVVRQNMNDFKKSEEKDDIPFG